MFVGRPGRILGIDPGLTRCGYAVVDSDGSGRTRAVSLGVLRSSPQDELPIRLAQLQADLRSLFDEFQPSDVAVERVFFQANVRTAMSVGQASGLVLAEAATRGCVVAQYTPPQVKETVAGWGGAGKAEIQRMVQIRLGLSTVPKPADAADAVALALCHLAVSPSSSRVAAAIGTKVR
ncbi:MAG: crossover junction endodeoxyribonuclease RuvC [Actinomycetota bacterium]